MNLGLEEIMQAHAYAQAHNLQSYLHTFMPTHVHTHTHTPILFRGQETDNFRPSLFPKEVSIFSLLPVPRI